MAATPAIDAIPAPPEGPSAAARTPGLVAGRLSAAEVARNFADAHPPLTPVQALIEADERDQRAFLERWAARAGSVTNARHRKMLQRILGEMAEHLRIFQQALEGRTDLLGRHSAGRIPRGEVMPTRPGN